MSSNRKPPHESNTINAENSLQRTICDLQKALDYLISRGEGGNDRSAKQPTNNSGNNSDTVPQHQIAESNQTNPTAIDVDTDDLEMLNAIPNLVNNILKEHYSSISEVNTTRKSSSCDSGISVDQKIFMTELLIAVIVEFAEPHFVRTSILSQKDENPTKKSKIECSNMAENIASSSSIQFSKRAVEWAKSSLSTLLKTTISDESTHIAELDALLGATGENDGLKLEELMQQTLLCGLMGARSNVFRNV